MMMHKTDWLIGCIGFQLLSVLMIIMGTKATVENGFRVSYVIAALLFVLAIVAEILFFAKKKAIDKLIVFAVLFESFVWCGIDCYLFSFLGSPESIKHYFDELNGIMAWWKWVFPIAMLLLQVIALLPAKTFVKKVNINKSIDQQKKDGAKGAIYGFLGASLTSLALCLLNLSFSDSPAKMFALTAIVFFVVACLAVFIVDLLVLVSVRTRKRVDET